MPAAMPGYPGGVATAEGATIGSPATGIVPATYSIPYTTPGYGTGYVTPAGYGSPHYGSPYNGSGYGNSSYGSPYGGYGTGMYGSPYNGYGSGGSYMSVPGTGGRGGIFRGR